MVYKNPRCSHRLYFGIILLLLTFIVATGCLFFNSRQYLMNYEVTVINEQEKTGDGQERIYIPTPKDGYRVPNVVHFIVFGKDKGFSFVNYLSILSAHKVQKPELILVHCDVIPGGPWWERLWKEVPLRIVHREPPSYIHGQKLAHIYHKGDIAKLEVLKEYGGIYLDYDVLVINPLDPLRKFPMTLGKEKTPKLIAGIILAERNALFIRILYESYRKNYWRRDWDYNCAAVAYKLYLKRPDLVHIETRRLTTPDWTERHLMYEDTVDWRDLYVLHLMFHKDRDEISLERIKTLKGIIGSVMRYIYYGNSSIIL